MARNYSLTPASCTFSVRFSAHDSALVQEEIKRSGKNTSEYFRGIWKDNRAQKQFNKQLIELEQRLLDKTFEMVAAIAGLDEHKRALAKKAYITRLKTGA